MFTVTYNDNGTVRRDVCTWGHKEYAADKARQLRKIFKEVKVVAFEKAKHLPTICD